MDPITPTPPSPLPVPTPPVMPLSPPPMPPPPVMQAPPPPPAAPLPKEESAWGKFFSILLGMLVLGALIYAGIWYWQGSQSPVPAAPSVSSMPAPLIPLATTTATSTVGSATDAYKKMKVDYDNIASIKDMFNFQIKYGTADVVAEAQSALIKLGNTQTGGISAVEENAILSLMKTTPKLSDITAIQEVPNGNTVTLNISTKIPGTTGTMVLYLENGRWKMKDSEKWTIRSS